MKIVAIFLAAALPAYGAPGNKRVHAIINSTPAGRKATWGLEVADSHTGQILYAFNAHKLFTPASNVKLLTTALALTKLGPTYRFETKVGREGNNLVLYGAGDANLSGRPIPYEFNGVNADPLRAMDALAEQIAATGLKSVDGDVIGDDTAFDYIPVPDGWSYEDAISDDGAPVSALCVNDNTVTLRIRKDAVEFEPNLPVFEVINEVTTGDAAHINVLREPGSNRLLLTGTLPAEGMSEQHLSVGDPARFAALALKAALIRHGVNVQGNALARHRYPDEPIPTSNNISPIATMESAPLIEDLRITDKVSQNLHAEILLRTVARQQDGRGSAKAGIQVLKDFLTTFQIPPEEYDIRDGSGLARKDMITPDALVRVLRGMDASPQAEAWRSLLPVSGIDGSLHERLGKAATGKVFAKTGSLTHVAALSGYARTRTGRNLTFSVIVNQFNGSASEMRALVDKVVVLMMQ